MIPIAAEKQGRVKHSAQKGKQVFSVTRLIGNRRFTTNDTVIREAPLEIHVAHGPAGNRRRELLSVTMRTPGDDFQLAAGFLFAEHIIHHASDIVSIRFTGNYEAGSHQENSLLVELSPNLKVDFSERKNFLTNSACGFCGRADFDAAGNQGIHIPFSGDRKVSVQTLSSLPSLLQSSQSLFTETGGSHAVGLVTLEGELIEMFEDVGRHNAMDKLIGAMLKCGAIPLNDRMVMFSGRLSYELVQKSLAAGIPVVCSIGAPTSLAIALASDFGMTVIGFLRNDRLNIYCGEERIQTDSKNTAI